MGFAYKGISISKPTMSGYSSNVANFEVTNTQVQLTQMETMNFDVETVDLNVNYNQSPVSMVALYTPKDTSFEATAATICVEITSMLSGAGKIIEYVSDADVFLRELPFYFGLKVKDFFMGTDDASKHMDNSLDYIRRDRTAEINKAFYEDTELGRIINDKSNIKYDSEEAMKIRNTSEGVAKFGAATALTVATGGTAAPIVVGAFYGGGKALEQYTTTVDRENGMDYNHTEAMFKAATGSATGAVEWWGSGQIGSMAVNGVKSLAALKAAGGDLSFSSVKSVVSSLKNSGIGKKAISNLRNNFTIKQYFKALGKNLLAKENLLPNIATSADHIVNFIFGYESGDEAIRNIRNEFLFNVVLESFGFLAKSSVIPSAEVNSKNVLVGTMDPKEVEDYLRDSILNDPIVDLQFKRDRVIMGLIHRFEDSDTALDHFRKIVDTNSFDSVPQELNGIFKLLDVDQYSSWLKEYDHYISEDWLKEDLCNMLESIIPNFDRERFIHFANTRTGIYCQDEWVNTMKKNINEYGGYNPAFNVVVIQDTGLLRQMQLTTIHEFIHKYSTPELFKFNSENKLEGITGFKVFKGGVSRGTGFNETITDLITNTHFGNNWTYNNISYTQLNSKFSEILDLVNDWGDNSITFEKLEKLYFTNDVDGVRMLFDSQLGDGFFDKYIYEGFDILNDVKIDDAGNPIINSKLVDEGIDIIRNHNLKLNGGL